MVTSHDVARLAGVSQPTVSRALRDHPKVSAETKGRVRDAARALGYVLSETGRALSSGRTRRIGLLLTDLENQFYPHVIAPMHDELEDLGYQLVLLTESEDTGQVVERLLSGGLDGIILATTTLDSLLPVRLRDRGVPFVYFNRNSPAVPADMAVVESTHGLNDAVAEAWRLGHRRFGAVFGPANTSTGQWREQVVRTALAERGAPLPATRTVRGPFDFPTGFAGATAMLGAAEPPTVIMCGNDVVALGALNAVADLGLRLAHDVSVVGFDDLPPAGWPIVQLTTVAFDLDGMARSAARLLVERVEGAADAPYQTRLFDSHLVMRRSLGAVLV